MLQQQSIEQQYLNGKIGDEEIIRHFQDGRHDAKKSEGAVYTPKWIVEAMLERADLDLQKKIVEPSAGHGSFILPLIRFVHSKFHMSWDETARWFISSVSSFDIDPESVIELRTIVAMLFAREGVAWISPDQLINIQNGDGLKARSECYDIAIGNPPYIRTQNLPSEYRDWIRESFEIAKKGNIDIYYAFLDHYMSKVQRCVFIVPNGCIKATGAKALRERVFPLVDEVVDFRSELVFPNARAYTCILTSTHGHSGPLALRHGISAPSSTVQWESITGAEIHSAPRVAKSGLATLADPVFAVTRDKDTETYTATFEGQPFEIEKGILRPLYKVTKLSAVQNMDCPERFVIFPYNSMNGNDVIDEDSLAKTYPKAHTYLIAAKQKLLSRDKGKTQKYPAWYAYGRTQGLHDLSNQEIVFVPTMIGGASKPKLFDTRIITAKFGAPLFVSGFAVVGSKTARDLLMSDLFIDYVRGNGSPKPGSSELYYAISSKHVNSFLFRELGAEAANNG